MIFTFQCNEYNKKEQFLTYPGNHAVLGSDYFETLKMKHSTAAYMLNSVIYYVTNFPKVTSFSKVLWSIFLDTCTTTDNSHSFSNIVIPAGSLFYMYMYIP